MKKITTSLIALSAIVCAQAQTTTTGSLYPVDHNVYNPAYYGNVMQVSYDNQIVVDDNTVATISVNGVSTALIPTDVTEYGFKLDLSNLADLVNLKGEFSINVEGVQPAAETNDEVENVSGTYIYLTSFPTATANPAGGALENAASTITVSFDEAVNVGNLYFMSGSFMNQKVNHVDGPEGYVTSLKAEILEDYWSQTETPANMSVRLGSVTIEGGWLVPDYTFAYTHEFPAETAEYVGYEPKNDEVTVWDAYGDGWGFVDLVFTGEVNYEEAEALVTYTMVGNITQKMIVAGEEMWGDWSFWDQQYHLEIPLPAYASLTEDNLLSISIEVYDITSNNKEVEIPVISYSKEADALNNAPKKSNTAGVNTFIANDVPMNVYTMQGNLVKSNASSSDIQALPAGMYIVGTKKVLVR